MKISKYLLFSIVLGGLLLSACSKKEGCTDSTANNYDSEAEEDDGSCTFDTTETTNNTTDTTSTNNGNSGTDTTSTGNNGGEGSATSGILAKYDGTYNVTGTGHNRGTVIISDNGTKIDFDSGISYDIDDNNVYDRISAFNRYQIEFFDSNNNQDRIRINLDPNDSNVVIGFEYDVGADEQDIITVTVQ